MAVIDRRAQPGPQTTACVAMHDLRGMRIVEATGAGIIAEPFSIGGAFGDGKTQTIDSRTKIIVPTARKCNLIRHMRFVAVPDNASLGRHHTAERRRTLL